MSATPGSRAGGPPRASGRAPRFSPGALAIAAGVLLVVLLVLGERAGVLPRPPEETRLDLTRARRVEVTAPGAYESLLLSLRVHHYRPQPQSEALYRDVYFDTDDLDLLRGGYSYRFRTRLEGGGGAKHSLHLEQEARFVPAGSARTELTTDLPDSLGEAIAAGDWHRAVEVGPGLAACERLLALLADLRAEASRARPRLVGELRRQRLDVTDKGRNWFRLDRERWLFRAFQDTSRSVGLEDVALDVRLAPRHPELVRRVRTLDGLLPMVHGLQPATRAPWERAMTHLLGT